MARSAELFPRGFVRFTRSCHGRRGEHRLGGSTALSVCCRRLRGERRRLRHAHRAQHLSLGKLVLFSRLSHLSCCRLGAVLPAPCLPIRPDRVCLVDRNGERHFGSLLTTRPPSGGLLVCSLRLKSRSITISAAFRLARSKMMGTNAPRFWLSSPAT